MIIKSFLIEGLDEVIHNHVKKSDIVDNLESHDPEKVLSANMGRVLAETYVPKSDIIDNLESNDPTKVLSANQGRLLRAEVKRDFIPKVDIINNLESNDPTKVLSANMGRVLKEDIEKRFIPKIDIVDNLDSNDSTKVLSANQGKHLKEIIDELKKSLIPFSLYDIYISYNGNDETGDGTDTNPYKTIHKAISTLPQISHLTQSFVVINLIQNNTMDAEYEISRTLNFYNFPWLRKIIFNGNGCKLNFNVDESYAMNIFSKPMITFNNCKFNFLSFGGKDVTTRTTEYEYLRIDSNNNPTRIYYYKNRQIIDITYKNDKNIDYIETLGYRVTFKYTDDNVFCGQRTTIISDNPSDKSEDLSGFLTEDYDCIEFDEHHNPRKIVYTSNGGIVRLFYREDNQLDYYLIAGYKVTFNYNKDNVYIGKTTEVSSEGIDDGTNKEIITADFRCTTDNKGNPLKVYYSNGQMVEFTYDELNNTVKTASTLGYLVNYNYDANSVFIGKTLTKIDEHAVDIDKDVSTILTSIYKYISYDDYGRPLVLEYNNGQQVIFNYRSDNQIESLETVGFKINYLYNSNNEFYGQETIKTSYSADIRNDTNKVITEDYIYTKYNSDNQPTEITYKSGQIIKITYRLVDGQIESMSTDNYTVNLYYNGSFLTEKETTYTAPDSPLELDNWINEDYSIELSNLNNRPYKVLYNNGIELEIHYTATNQLSYILSSDTTDKIIFEYNDNDILLKKIIESTIFVPAEEIQRAYCIYLDERSAATFNNCEFFIKANFKQIFQLERDSSCYIENCIIDANNLDIDYVINCYKNKIDMLQCTFTNIPKKLFNIDASLIRFNDTTTINNRAITDNDYNMVNHLYFIIL